MQPHSIVDIPDEGTVLDPVVGGSGTLYLSIALAQAGEAAIPAQVDRITGLVPQPGTVAGSLVGPAALSAVDDFYKDYYVVNTDSTPTNGLVSQWARVSSYVGATRTLILDKPWDFAAESDFTLVKVVRIALLKDMAEDVTFTAGVELDLAGHRLKGRIDCTGEEFHWIRGGSGYVTNGIQKTAFGLLKVDDCTVSRRDATIYALLMTNGSNLGRCELINSRFMGRVSGRRGRAGWTIYNCKNLGVVDSTVFDDLSYTLWESVAGVAIVVDQADISVDGEFGGAVFYSENIITGPTAFLSTRIDVRAEQDYVDPAVTPRNFSFFRARASAVLTLTVGNDVLVTCHNFFRPNTLTTANPEPYFISVRDFTGTVTITLNNPVIFAVSNCDSHQSIFSEGTVDMTGAITVNGAQTLFITADPIVSMSLVTMENRITTGSVTFSAPLQIAGGSFRYIFFLAAHDGGAPSIIASGTWILQKLAGFRLFQALAVSITTGIYTMSGPFNLYQSILTNFATLRSSTSGGTWTVSGSSVNMDIQSGGNADFILADHQGSGGTLNISSTNIRVNSDRWPGLMRIISMTGTGGTITVSGAVTLIGFSSATASNNGLVVVTTIGPTGNLTGTVNLVNCRFEAAYTFVIASVAGGTSQGPAALLCEGCFFEGALTTQSGAGTLTWTGAAIRFRQCHIDGLYTVVYTAFTTHEAFHSRFNGGSSNKSITGSGTRPTTLRYWACTAAQRYDDILPEWISVYDVLPAQAALVQGQPVNVNGANQYQVCVAVSIVDGVLLAAAGAAGTFAVCVRSGRVFVAVNAAVANGDNLALDLVTPTQCSVSAFVPGQDVGIALQAAGTTVAGKSYATVGVR